jgi:autotransporter-associated beta strand protein
MSPTVTVSNATTTLTVGGVITDGTASYGLTKAGAGTLKFTGKNTYKGPTTVNAGTLVITQACLSAGAGVHIASGGAKLNLNFTGTNNVLAVFLDGSLTAAGTWGATGSGAANIDDTHFSGTGVLSHNGGLVATNTWYWDGPNYGGTGDGLSTGGNGIWSVSTNNWDQGIVSRKVWPNTTNDMAFFNTVAGTVTLGSSLTLGSLDIRGVDYTIGGASETNTLNFGGTNTITVYGQNATFNSGISGYPTVNFDGGLKTLRLQPTATVNMNLGTINVTKIQGGDSYLYLDGTSAGNTVGDMTWPGGQWLRIYKQGSGTWTVNGAINAAGGAVLVPGITGGALIISTSGSMYMTQGFTLNGGALHLNNPGAYRGSTMGITSGSLDNSSGSAITTSTYNPAQSWGGNFTFIGSQGTNSDLYLGNGAVALTVSPVVTINSNATLTVGGVVSGAFGLTKSGTGTLRLSGNNTYSGATMVTNGTLQLVAGSSCSNSAVTVTNTTGITSAFGVVVTNSARQAVCSNLTVSAVGGAAQLKFSFSVAPSFVQAPLVIRNTLAFNNSPTIVVAPANLVAGKKYPLLTVGGTPPGTVPNLSITGMSGTLAWEGNTLYLSMTPNGTLISFF